MPQHDHTQDKRFPSTDWAPEEYPLHHYVMYLEQFAQDFDIYPQTLAPILDPTGSTTTRVKDLPPMDDATLDRFMLHTIRRVHELLETATELRDTLILAGLSRDGLSKRELAKAAGLSTTKLTAIQRQCQP